MRPARRPRTGSRARRPRPRQLRPPARCHVPGVPTAARCFQLQCRDALDDVARARARRPRRGGRCAVASDRGDEGATGGHGAAEVAARRRRLRARGEPRLRLQDNAAAAESSLDPKDSAAALGRAGRLSGYSLRYDDLALNSVVRRNGVIGVETSVSLFTSPDCSQRLSDQGHRRRRALRRQVRRRGTAPRGGRGGTRFAAWASARPRSPRPPGSATRASTTRASASAPARSSRPSSSPAPTRSPRSTTRSGSPSSWPGGSRSPRQAACTSSRSRCRRRPSRGSLPPADPRSRRWRCRPPTCRPVRRSRARPTSPTRTRSGGSSASSARCASAARS